MATLEPIRPLFILNNNAEQMGKSIIAFAHDDYNKELGSALIDAKDDAQAISSFLTVLWTKINKFKRAIPPYN